MRKLTGYIGAMIIVFALMGSVLMGYALNVNGTNTIVNEYEKVTDVSGLYSHSEEKSYIEYNPATNYVGYKTASPLYSDAGTTYHKDITTDKTLYVTVGGTVYVDGKTILADNNIAYNIPFVCDFAYLQYNVGALSLVFYSVDNSMITLTDYATIVINGNTVTFTINGNTYEYQNCLRKVCQWDNDGYDYFMIYGRLLGNNSDVTAYCTESNQIISISRITPALNSNVGSTNLISVGANYAYIGMSVYVNGNIWPFNAAPIGDGVYSLNANFEDWYVEGWETPPVYKTMSGYFIFYPSSVLYMGADPAKGINYTQSNRVNNYPIEYDYNQYTTIQTETVDLMALSAANQFTYNDGWYIGLGSNSADNHDGYYSFAGYFKIKNGVYEYKLSDILSTLTIPAGTTTINIDTGQLNLAVATTNVSVPTSIVSYGYLPVYSTVPYNTELTTIFPSNNQYAGQVTTDNQFNYGIYYPDTGLVEIYDKRNNVKLWTASANDAVIRFVDSGTNTGTYDYNYDGYVNGGYVSGTNGVSFNLGARGTPQLNITYTINGAITNTYYMDITKGVSIKSTNYSPVIWDNQYENGVIDILFRAESNTDIYHNELTVSNNTIAIDFDGGRYSITLNGADPVDIGTWRNIVLSIDLINGKLYVIPVKTFNSYTNVVLTNTSVLIGDLIGAQPTGTISWALTNKSFTFNVYSTNVFMDTYGLMMVNPSLNISDYFTDLNEFYRLEMYNFATYGDSITINGETLPVNNGLVTYDNKSLELRNFNITYADGKVSIGDNHTTIEMGDIVTTDISMSGAWYFLTDLERGFTTQKVIYDWDWGTFIFDNTQFCIFYLGFMAAALIVARKFCSITITDYAVVVVSIIIALGVQVIA